MSATEKYLLVEFVDKIKCSEFMLMKKYIKTPFLIHKIAWIGENIRRNSGGKKKRAANVKK